VEGEENGRGIYETKESAERGEVAWLAGNFFEGDFHKNVEGRWNV